MGSSCQKRGRSAGPGMRAQRQSKQSVLLFCITSLILTLTPNVDIACEETFTSHDYHVILIRDCPSRMLAEKKARRSVITHSESIQQNVVDVQIIRIAYILPTYRSPSTEFGDSCLPQRAR